MDEDPEAVVDVEAMEALESESGGVLEAESSELEERTIIDVMDSVMTVSVGDADAVLPGVVFVSSPVSAARFELVHMDESRLPVAEVDPLSCSEDVDGVLTSVEVNVMKRIDDEGRLLAGVPVAEDEIQIEELYVDVVTAVEKSDSDSVCLVVDKILESSNSELDVGVVESPPVKVKELVKVEALELDRTEVLKDSTEPVMVVDGLSELGVAALLVAGVDPGSPCCVPESAVPLTTVVLTREERERSGGLVPGTDDDESTLELEASGLNELEARESVSSGVAADSVMDITRVTVNRIVLPTADDDGNADVSGVAVLIEVQESR
ncbi:hypothetical protein HRG_004531 [Hirsutella rhossiliensis]|uniref:Uncharacterized protein n=1 Tax=Hirsutella rhossiliensis TaxID=111463 RepID=A0A9P8MXF8_9HYPO|nr:uncharacterized protein HRG_04531 [Hirsutella rhossiliensis]KAH0964103.1 hypothetical protein HRG_04531 [Hirsutella rhossiliensis]